MLGRGLLDLDILVNLTVALDPAIVAGTAGARIAENFKQMLLMSGLWPEACPREPPVGLSGLRPLSGSLRSRGRACPGSPPRAAPCLPICRRCALCAHPSLPPVASQVLRSPMARSTRRERLMRHDSRTRTHTHMYTHMYAHVCRS